MVVCEITWVMQHIFANVKHLRAANKGVLNERLVHGVLYR